MSSGKPIGIFDSGVGGLSVLRHVQAQLPQEHIIYLADQAHIPYGSRSPEEIWRFSQEITRFLLLQQVKLIIVACNTASAAALSQLRAHFSPWPFVGMEPAVKPAALKTRNGKVGVLATTGTFGSERYASLMHRFAQDVDVWEDPCVELVETIEAGHIHSPVTEQLLRSYLTPMMHVGVDTVVLGCTHYPFVMPLIARIVGPAVTIIDPAPAVAQQARRVLQQTDSLILAGRPGRLRLITTGKPQKLAQFAAQVGIRFRGDVETAVWQNGKLSILQS